MIELIYWSGANCASCLICQRSTYNILVTNKVLQVCFVYRSLKIWPSGWPSLFETYFCMQNIMTIVRPFTCFSWYLSLASLLMMYHNMLLSLIIQLVSEVIRIVKAKNDKDSASFIFDALYPNYCLRISHCFWDQIKKITLSIYGHNLVPPCTELPVWVCLDR